MNETPTKAIAGKSGVRGFGERLKCVRKMRRMTQLELGQKSGMTADHISHFECGIRLPNAENLRAISIALNTSADYLLDSNQK